MIKKLFFFKIKRSCRIKWHFRSLYGHFIFLYYLQRKSCELWWS